MRFALSRSEAACQIATAFDGNIRLENAMWQNPAGFNILPMSVIRDTGLIKYWTENERRQLSNTFSANGKIGVVFKSCTMQLLNWGFFSISTLFKPRPQTKLKPEQFGKCELKLDIKSKIIPFLGR